MSIEADDRRAAFLREMGISEWMPKSRGEEAPLISSESTVIDAAPTLEPEPFASPLVVDDAIARRERISRLDWPTLRTEVAGCVACDLCKSRRQTVFGVGAEQAPWMLIGEAPGAEEDARGEPFVGQAGRLLDNMLKALGLSRDEQVFIANVLKCRPPGNRDPQPGEVHACDPFLKRQIELVNPRIIVVLGRFAAQSLLATDASIARLRGQVHKVEVARREVPVVVTYHPAYLLRNLPDKAKAWVDWNFALDTYRAEAAA